MNRVVGNARIETFEDIDTTTQKHLSITQLISLPEVYGSTLGCTMLTTLDDARVCGLNMRSLSL